VNARKRQRAADTKAAWIWTHLEGDFSGGKKCKCTHCDKLFGFSRYSAYDSFEKHLQQSHKISYESFQLDARRSQLTLNNFIAPGDAGYVRLLRFFVRHGLPRSIVADPDWVALCTAQLPLLTKHTVDGRFEGVAKIVREEIYDSTQGRYVTICADGGKTNDTRTFAICFG